MFTTGTSASCCGYLDVDQQLQQVFGGHDDGGVEWDDVALVQGRVVVGGQPLTEEHSRAPSLVCMDTHCAGAPLTADMSF